MLMQRSQNVKEKKGKPWCMAHSSPSGFTLIELLVVAVIAGILMSMVVGALRGAQEDANVAKTRATIRKIDSIIQDRYEQYRYESLDFVMHTTLGTTAITPIAGTSNGQYPSTQLEGFAINTGLGGLSTNVNDNVLQARLRLALLRDRMRLEMPDCYGDMYVLSNSAGVYLSETDINTGYTYLGNPVYARLTHPPLYEQLRLTIISRTADPEFQARNFNAELLFLIVESSYMGGGYGIESFANGEIGDTDGDGLREFIDAWDRPIQWLRWPAGYSNDSGQSQLFSLRTTAVTVATNRFDPDPLLTASIELSGNIAINRDDFDFNQADIGYAFGTNTHLPGGPLRPLVISGGRDGETGLRFHWTGPNARNPSTHLFSVARGFVSGTYYWPDPYYPRPGMNGVGVASIDDPVRNAPLNLSLGGVLNVYVDSASTTTFNFVKGFDSTGALVYDADFVPITGSTPEEINSTILEFTSDNVANFDETGGAL